jgi:hypothetical protein
VNEYTFELWLGDRLHEVDPLVCVGLCFVCSIVGWVSIVTILYFLGDDL